MSDLHFEAAIVVMRENSSVILSRNYLALFKSEWRKRDPEQTGELSKEDVLQMVEAFVADGWQDWRLGSSELAVLDEIAEIFDGRVPIAEFARWAEDSEYHPEVPASESAGQQQPARSKPQAAKALAEKFEARAKSFDPTKFSGESAKRDAQSESHCVDCAFQQICQHVYTCCPQCSGDALDYMTVCSECAAKIGRCCACTKTLV